PPTRTLRVPRPGWHRPGRFALAASRLSPLTRPSPAGHPCRVRVGGNRTLADPTHRSEDMTSAALVVAHPGHELRVHGWLERHRPVVFVLTDGSGSTASSRLHSTQRILLRAEARQGSIFGRFSD